MNIRQETKHIVTIEEGVTEESIRSACGLAFAAEKQFPQLSHHNDKGWQLEFYLEPSPESLQRFWSTLNDYRLRELISKDTDDLRSKIIRRALVNAYRHHEN